MSMRTFTISTWYLALLLVTACGGDSSSARKQPDAGSVPDASTDSGAPLPDASPVGMPGPLERLDWRTTRGATIATSAVTLPTTSLFALSGDGFVTQSECQNPSDCTFTWQDLAGTPGMRRDHMTRVTSIATAPDGRRAQLVALAAMETCNDAQGTFQVARGALQLLDLAT